MAKSRARFLAELLGTDGLVKKAKSALAGADEVIDLDVLPSIPNSKLTNSSITINSSATSLGGSVTLTTANVAENTNLYYTDARADARIAAADTGDLSEGSNLYYTNARADARVNLQTGSNLNLSSKDTGDLSEGSNLYYTNARADARIAAASTSDLSEGTNLYYTDARADARVALIVDSAPGTLNTLNELAAALGDDANFSTTVTNSIAAKLPLAGGTLTGNLSIGGATPQGNLTIKGAASDDIDLLTFSEDGTNQSFSFNGNFAGSGSTGNNLTLDSYWTNDIMAWTGDGNVGIGTDAPGEKLVIKGTTSFMATNSTNRWMAYTYTDNTFRLNYNGAGADELVIDSSGNVGIGTDSPDFTLDVEADKDTWLSRIYNTGSDANSQVLLVRSDATAAHDATVLGVYADSDYKMVIKSSGNVGIGTLSPTEKLEVVGTALVENAKLKAIAESNTDSAVDVFVYDTRKDSDGGAWRKRTQHTSWYNETLNTSTRGARKEFPSVAVIVAESNQVTIYDGDDPDMPMWMIFNGTGGYGSYLGRTSGANVTSVQMLNGNLCVGRGNSGYGEALLRANFISEHSVNYAVGGWRQLQPIAGRHLDATSNVQLNYAGINAIINIAINDVAMTVLPNAPIDPDTGLPVPTIAVATDGGVSVIKDDGTVVDIVSSTAAGGGYDPEYVSFDQDNRLTLVQAYDAGAPYLNIFENIPSADVAQALVYSGATSYTYLDTGLNISGGSANFADLAHTKEEVALGFSTRLSLLDSIPGAPTKSMVAYVTSDYNTGYMVGNTKVATLSDTDATNATSANMAGNGNFANTNVWFEQNGATLSVSGNVGTITGDGSNTQAYIGQTVAGLTVGKQYMITCDAKRGTTVAAAAITVNGILSAMTTSTTFVPLHVTFTATATSQLVLCFMNGTGSQSGTALFQNFTFRLAEADRSVNGAKPHGGNALQVFGTVTKTAVATGAELVAYSGFTTANYLQQPYSSGLNFGTGDFSIGFWLKYGVNDTQYVMDRSVDGNQRIAVYLTDPSGGTLNLYTNGEGSQASEITGIFGSDDWVQCWCIRRSGTLEIWVNGVNKASSALTSRDVTQLDSAPLVIARRFNGNSSTIGTDVNLALFRISATAPSAEQIAKMYNDEKFLFQENAKATLYGTSDAVTALAYDDDTELLHVGTSAGRSEFQGLRRVDNTTDAVGTSISASNGFIVEE